MEHTNPAAPRAANARLRLSRILAATAAVLLLVSYLLGPLFRYKGAAGHETEINNSFEPFALFELGKDEQGRLKEPTLLTFLSGYHSVPVWRVNLEAPQYPKSVFPDGIPVFFNLTWFTGEVQEMNTINHYVGMRPMEVGAKIERRIVPLVYVLFFVCLAVFWVYRGPLWWVFGLVPALMPVYFLAVFSYWLYWFGHNLQGGAFTLKPFMPTVLGDGKVAQFTTHSYPHLGFYVLAAVFLVLILAILVKRRGLQEAAAAAPSPAQAA
ncbi:MAG: cytochrome C [Candidatus Lambdaproteobacteria bacterium]|nr:cytochrome C [Candidatus Lambdaproteobacteria bacterium]